MDRPHRYRAFTLVELLVVIGIISVLIAVLMPALTRSRKLAQRAQCLSNMRQLGTAFASYAAQSGGRTPVQPNLGVYDFFEPGVYDRPADAARAHLQGRNAFATLLPLVGGDKRVYVCPAASEYAWDGETPTAVSDTSYLGNQVV